MKFLNLTKFFSILILALIIAIPSSAQAREQFIRDTEIERLIKSYSFPIFEAANLDPYSVNLLIIDSPTINAFVAGGSNIFLYTGLILETKTPLELAGVIAHETGHITGGHLIRTQNNIKEAQMQSIIGMILGGLVAAGSGQGRGGVAASQAAQSMLERQLLSYSRVHENAADQAGFGFLKEAGYSLVGSVDFLKKLQSQEGRSSSVSNEYTRTHPLTKDRINAAIEQYSQTKELGLDDLSQFQEAHDRIKAKIFAYNYPDQTQFLYGGKSIVDHYARAMAAYRKNNLSTFEKEINILIEREPNNPYFWELKGQAMLENGKLQEALIALEKASMFSDNAPLIITLYAHALIQTQDNQNLEQAITLLQRAEKIEKGSAFRHRLLGLAYGQLGKKEIARLHQAEEAFYMRDYKLLDRILPQLKDAFDTGSSNWIKYQDLVQINERVKSQQK